MTIQAGERMPEGKFKTMGDKGPKDLSSAELFGGKRVVLFSVPGAFTPTCDAKHLPGYLGLADQLRAEQYRHFRGESWLEDLLAARAAPRPAVASA